MRLNGRVYNPEVGRFLSADPFVEAPGNIQAYNRYSYALNNPLTRIDPSGYLSFGDFGLGFIDDAFEDAWDFAEDNWRPITAVAITVATGGSGGWAGAAWASAGGFAAGYVASGGDFEAALVGAGSALLFHGAGELFQSELAQSFTQSYGSGATRVLQVVTHGAIGGARAEALGGRFRNGFLSAGAAKAITPSIAGAADQHDWGHAEQIVVAATVGGTASSLGGGKFGNGAVTAAFGYTFNQLASRARAAQARAEAVKGQALRYAGQRQQDLFVTYEGRQMLLQGGATILGTGALATVIPPQANGSQKWNFLVT